MCVLVFQHENAYTYAIHGLNCSVLYQAYQLPVTVKQVLKASMEINNKSGKRDMKLIRGSKGMISA